MIDEVQPFATSGEVGGRAGRYTPGRRTYVLPSEPDSTRDPLQRLAGTFSPLARNHLLRCSCGVARNAGGARSRARPADIRYYPNPWAAHPLDAPCMCMSRYEQQGDYMMLIGGEPASKCSAYPQGGPTRPSGHFRNIDATVGQAQLAGCRVRYEHLESGAHPVFLSEASRSRTAGTCVSATQPVSYHVCVTSLI